MNMVLITIVIGALIVCAALAGMLMMKPRKKAEPLAYEGPILPKTYNDRYPKRSQMLVNKPPVEEEQPQPKSEVGSS